MSFFDRRYRIDRNGLGEYRALWREWQMFRWRIAVDHNTARATFKTCEEARACIEQARSAQAAHQWTTNVCPLVQGRHPDRATVTLCASAGVTPPCCQMTKEKG